MRIKLSEITDAMEMQSQDVFAYLNTATGETMCVSSEALDAVETDENEDMYDELELNWARQTQSDNCIPLPDQREIDEYRMMEDFVYSLTDEKVADQIGAVMGGSGAFRRFKDAVYRLGVEKEWFAFRSRAFREIAIEWCRDNNIEYDDD